VTLESWQRVAEFPDYEVSDHGNVRSYKRGPSPRAMALTKDQQGYIRIRLRKAGDSRFVAVHRLVAMAFLGSPPLTRPEVNHINGARDDNRVHNLEWVSRVENVRHAIDRIGNHLSGEQHPLAKLDWATVRMIRTSPLSGDHLSRALGMTSGVISGVRLGTRWPASADPGPDGPVAELSPALIERTRDKAAWVRDCVVTG
jgi:hypothetical protein